MNSINKFSSIAVALILCVALILNLNSIIQAADLTRTAGLVNYPNLNNDNHDNYYVAPPNNNNYNYNNQNNSYQQQNVYPSSLNYNTNNQMLPGGSTQFIQNPPKIRILLTRTITYYPDENVFRAPDESYYGVIGVGQQETKVFNVVMDTGTSETWLPEYKNLNIFAKNLHYRTGFDCRDSQSCTIYSGKYTFNYRGTTMYSFKTRDIITLYQDMTKEVALVLPSTNSKVSRDFLVVEEASDDQFRYKPYDGVLGLGPKLVSSTGGEHIMLSIKQQQQHFGPGNDWYNMIFSFWFNPNLNSNHGGELLLGGIDENRLNSRVNYHQLVNQDDWMISLNSVMLGNQIISCPDNCVLSLDTGANSLVGPRDDIYQIHQQLGAQFDQTANIYQVDCSRVQNFPRLTFIIDEIQYILTPAHYVKQFRFKDSNVCHLAIKPWDKQQWLVGTTFMKAFYTVFDLGHRQIGFATPAEDY